MANRAVDSSIVTITVTQRFTPRHWCDARTSLSLPKGAYAGPASCKRGLTCNRPDWWRMFLLRTSNSGLLLQMILPAWLLKVIELCNLIAIAHQIHFHKGQDMVKTTSSATCPPHMSQKTFLSVRPNFPHGQCNFTATPLRSLERCSRWSAGGSMDVKAYFWSRPMSTISQGAQKYGL